MKLDKSKPYGQVFGHHSASYEQDGKFFDGGGKLIPESKEAAVPTPAPETAKFVGGAGAFLLRILKEGPMSKGGVYKEAEEAKLNWADVKNAAVTLNVHVYSQKSTEYWKLVENVVA
jgi:hypothetical protein